MTSRVKNVRARKNSNILFIYYYAIVARNSQLCSWLFIVIIKTIVTSVIINYSRVLWNNGRTIAELRPGSPANDKKKRTQVIVKKTARF